MDQKSKKIFDENVVWLLSSDIRIREGPNMGALYGWKNLNPPSFPFIYSEITGYAITFFTWLASELGNPDALDAALQASDWIIRNVHSNLLFARPQAKPNQPNDLSNLLYSFDNSMIVIGMLNLYKLTKKTRLLQLADEITNAIIERFFDGEKLLSRIDKSFKPINSLDENGVVKWSTISGAYHCKLSIGLIELSRLTNDKKYTQISDTLCEYAKKLQQSDGHFITNPGSDIVYLHPHLYACEGLIFSGLKRSKAGHYAAGLNGIKWAMKQISSDYDGVYRDTGKESVEQSDCTAQLLRLLILCQAELEKSIKKSELNNIIERLGVRLLDFYITSGQAKGSMRYHISEDTACSWCTMFSAQALTLWRIKHSDKLAGMDYFV